MNKMRFKMAVGVCLCGMVVGLMSGSAFAGFKSWDVETAGSWHVAGNWNPSGVPDGVDSVSIFGPTCTISTDDATASIIDIGNGKLHLDGSQTLSTNGIQMDGVYASGVAYYEQEAGTTAWLDSLLLADWPEVSGTPVAVCTLDGGSLYVEEWVIVGEMCYGTFTQNGGLHYIGDGADPNEDPNGDLCLGWDTAMEDPETYAWYGHGEYTLTDGRLAAGWEYIGYEGKGEVLHTGGENYVTYNLYMAYYTGSLGTYELSGTGTLTAGNEYVGVGQSSARTPRGEAFFTQYDGTNATGSLHLGYCEDSAGWYEIQGGELSVGKLYVGFDPYDGFGSLDIQVPDEPNQSEHKITVSKQLHFMANSRFLADPNVDPTIDMRLVKTFGDPNDPNTCSWFNNTSTDPRLSDPDDPNETGLEGLQYLTLICEFDHDSGLGNDDPYLVFEVAGKDLGLDPNGFDPNNFVLKKLIVGRDPNDVNLDPNAGGMILEFVDNSDNSSGTEALYTENLEIRAGVGFKLNGSNGLDYNVYYQNGGSVKKLYPGDADLDGKVDHDDRITWENNRADTGGTWSVGDFDGDRDVDEDDLAILDSNYSGRADINPSGYNWSDPSNYDGTVSFMLENSSDAIYYEHIKCAWITSSFDSNHCMTDSDVGLEHLHFEDDVTAADADRYWDSCYSCTSATRVSSATNVTESIAYAMDGYAGDADYNYWLIHGEGSNQANKAFSEDCDEITPSSNVATDDRLAYDEGEHTADGIYNHVSIVGSVASNAPTNLTWKCCYSGVYSLNGSDQWATPHCRPTSYWFWGFGGDFDPDYWHDPVVYRKK